MKPELLAPVGTHEMALAAIHNGADALYVGMPGYNARGRTADFTFDELATLGVLARRYGVRLYVAWNILLFQDELSPLLPDLLRLCDLSPDAIIVQDVGLARLIRAVAPQQGIHASTQMSVTAAEAIACYQDLDIARFILARELSLDALRRIRRETDAELEVFVHGALCVAYSGQCLTSESIGGRSANRGQCAQSCRFAYDLMVDGQPRTLGVRRYLVSPHDLCGLRHIPELVAMGIESFKIEGRLKSPEHIAAVVASYRRAIDAAVSSTLERDPLQEIMMEVTFSRGVGSGWLQGTNNQSLVSATYSAHRGFHLGTVESCDKRSLVIQASHRVERGDGLLFAGDERCSEHGGAIYDSTALGKQRYRIEMARDFPLHAVRAGDGVYWNSAPEQQRQLRLSYQDKHRLRRIPVSFEVQGTIGTPLSLRVSDPEGRTVCVESTSQLELSQKAPLTVENVRQACGTLSDTAYQIDQFHVFIANDLFLHSREIKQMRRLALEMLDAQRIAATPSHVVALSEAQQWLAPYQVTAKSMPQVTTPRLNVLLRLPQQLEALAGMTLGTVYLDFEYGQDYGAALQQLRQMGHTTAIATNRILKPGEWHYLKTLAALKPDGFLLRNAGALQWLKQHQWDGEYRGDFSFNITNAVAAKTYQNFGLSTLCPSYDLNQWQLLALLRAAPEISWEVTLHHHMPAFHMDFCVFAAFLTNAVGYPQCGTICERHRVALRDPEQVSHPVKTDEACRNTMFHGIAQSSAFLIPDLKQHGVREYRIEALFDTAEQLRQKLQCYQDLFAGRIDNGQLVRELQVSELCGINEGQLMKNKAYRSRKR
ncbi:U32 family peptidase [Chrysiogenes arsenatis]|uniref:U32 family peptidase n=1 Tax=Chrysiogenes arsenatis TaxID=309797 RepID=UPI00040F3AAB|nr:U32 family peptidase [Chrysiogenes arsenatis]